MKGKYPDHKTYKDLYLRYHSGRDVKELIELLEPLQGKSVLDLCAGEGQVTFRALDHGAFEATAVDAEEAMLSKTLWRHQKILVLTNTVHDVLNDMRKFGKTVDRIACRQAINYWLDEESARLLADVLTPGGILAFNTFNQKPPEKPLLKEYELEGHSFSEVSWLIGETVHHVQGRKGMLSHHTSFQWISPEKFRELLEPHFNVTEEKKGNTSLYRCVKK